MVWIRNAAIHRAYRRTLGFVMEALTFGAFIARDIVKIVCNRGLFGIYRRSAIRGLFQRSAVLPRPLYAAFINGIIRALGLASPAVNAFVRYHYRHKQVVLMVGYNGLC